MIKIIDSILTDSELDFLINEVCPLFINSPQYDELNGQSKSYNSMFIDDYPQLDRFKSEVVKIAKKLNYNCSLNNPGIFINKIDSDKNQNDLYHHDGNTLTLIVYLNDNFIGGEFEYVDVKKNIKHIYPSPNLTIVMDRAVPHKVLPVKEGIRYSLITWLHTNKDSLI
jgi:hypothetical protein